MKIGILTCFTHLSPTLSLVHVVESHIEILLKHGYDVRLIVCEGCSKSERFGIFSDERIEWREVINTYADIPIPWINYYEPESILSPEFESYVTTVSDCLYDCLKDLSLCMLHDILYHNKFYLHNVALRRIQPKLSSLRFLAFTHSFPYFRPASLSPQQLPRFTPLPHTHYVYPTHSGISSLAKQYQIPEALCHTVYHPTFTLTHPLIQQLHQKVDLLSPDLLIVYPARLSLGKKQDKLLSLAGALKLIGDLSIRIIFCDFYGHDTDGTAYKSFLYKVGMQYGLLESEMIFTTDLGYPNGLPHEVISELFKLSNLFICPSISESFSLVLLEAAQAGNFIVTNENVPALKELGSLLNTYPMRWDAREDHYTIIENYEPSEAAYYGCHATRILKEMNENRVLHSKTIARQRFNSEWIWYHQLEPLVKEILYC